MTLAMPRSQVIVNPPLHAGTKLARVAGVGEGTDCRRGWRRWRVKRYVTARSIMQTVGACVGVSDGCCHNTRNTTAPAPRLIARQCRRCPLCKAEKKAGDKAFVRGRSYALEACCMPSACRGSAGKHTIDIWILYFMVFDEFLICIRSPYEIHLLSIAYGICTVVNYWRWRRNRLADKRVFSLH